MGTIFFALSSSLLLLSCQNAGGKVSTNNLQDSIQKDSSFNLVKDMATNVIKSGFNAGMDTVRCGLEITIHLSP
ncbi:MULTISPECIES: hypothetical protein [unclassified Sphingobacterium]|uniref:hypothetical protein n=1 Tax=unclassified Sphingobacterium TaxID=2609468 RepID=UPI0025FCAA6C|nr:MULTISPECIES: hypothetical protein [unclassified Sphingobacterium]